ncbi:family 20 glycosylhydrolase [Bacteroides sp.]|uniref:family 20 glycosylhydrolase n=1 Tax=Bacteroides sp. TaxID=29523 RepID=UPI002FCB02DE
MKNTLLLLLLSIAFPVTGKSLDKVFQLMPQPQKVEVKSGIAFNHDQLTYLVTKEGTDIPVLRPILDALPRSVRKGKGVQLTLTTNGVPDSDEGYVLQISTNGASILAKTSTGLFYGCQTLEQLLEDSRDFHRPIPAMVITDYPSIPYRAIHVDTKHHLNRMEYYYRLIDHLASYKINGIIWELEDKLRYTRRPEIASPNAISKQEMQAISRYAKERNIEISPLVQGLGHASFILKHHWELREHPNSDHDFCPADPRTYELQFDLYRDAIEAMPYGKYLHIGGDEINSIGEDSRCLATGKTAFELQMYWLQKVCKFATDQGRTPIFWDDMPLKHAGIWDLLQNDTLGGMELERQWNSQKLDDAINLFPKECIYMRWKYEEAVTPVNLKLLNWYREKGLKVMASTATATGNSLYLPREIERTDYIKGFSRIAAENKLEGILATTWDDGSPHSAAVLREMIAQGEYGWNPYARDRKSFSLAYGQREFGFNPADSLSEFINDLKAMADFFDGALVIEGVRNPAWGVTPFRLLPFPDSQNPGVWSKQYADKITEAEVAMKRYNRVSSILSRGKANALRNRYPLAVYEQTSHLFAYPVQLILALRNYDCADTPDEKATALRAVTTICDNFTTMRQTFEKVYSEIRFMTLPDGYIEQIGRKSHLSAMTSNSDWMFYFELPMIKELKKWIQKTSSLYSL